MRYAVETRTAAWFKRVVVRGVRLLAIAVALTSCGSWRGIANVPLPGSASDRGMTIYVQIPNVLALNVNSRVRVADVYVGTVRAIELKDWIPTLTLNLRSDVKLPENSLAMIGQTSLLGSQHVELKAPPNASLRRLQNGATIPLKSPGCPPPSHECTSSFPTVERTLASIATVLRGGGIPNLEVIQNEAYNLLSGRASQIRDFLGRLDTTTRELDKQREDITRVIDSTDRLVSIVAHRNETLDRVLTEFPPLAKHFADNRGFFIDAVEAVGRLSANVDQAIKDMGDDLQTNLRLLQRPLQQLSRAAPYVIDALKVFLAQPFNIDNVEKVVRGDYVNVSSVLDLTLSTLDNGMLTGTRFSGALRALEQSWGRDPATMIPDIRYAPNPADAPVRRGE
ncbi:MCE family protein [Mycobacterium arosiense]|uniref:Mammalian cell entry protein n=1 Tax=Mycobacterium arosiense ATCC BAA-1401 = DSM 45069 TaxID=1265311 RepID=A0A1W9ZQN1_MYCAI|nr:MCE family protein [Mycobacterium arosiense]ORA20147.1 mammalian cell entry protein [Mycobacterium arosiense ATCC BAA-1401 = DSM 45069]